MPFYFTIRCLHALLSHLATCLDKNGTGLTMLNTRRVDTSPAKKVLNPITAMLGALPGPNEKETRHCRVNNKFIPKTMVEPNVTDQMLVLLG